MSTDYHGLMKLGLTPDEGTEPILVELNQDEANETAQILHDTFVRLTEKP